MHHLVRLLQGSKLYTHDLCSTIQHKNRVIFAGVVWLGLPIAIKFNYHLALYVLIGSLLHGLYMTCT